MEPEGSLQSSQQPITDPYPVPYESSVHPSILFIKSHFNVVYQLVRICGLVVRVPGYWSRGPGFDFRRYQIFWEIVDLERGPLSLVRIIEELLE
jgi:hypothetical protein